MGGGFILVHVATHLPSSSSSNAFALLGETGRSSASASLSVSGCVARDGAGGDTSGVTGAAAMVCDGMRYYALFSSRHLKVTVGVDGGCAAAAAALPIVLNQVLKSIIVNGDGEYAVESSPSIDGSDERMSVCRAIRIRLRAHFIVSNTD